MVLLIVTRATTCCQECDFQQKLEKKIQTFCILLLMLVLQLILNYTRQMSLTNSD